MKSSRTQPERAASSDVADALPSILEWLDQATHVLLGAGMSAAAGIDYGDKADFARRFPALHQKGFRARYELIGYERWSPVQHWAYWATHVHNVRFGPRDDAVYRRLLDLVHGKDTFVLTSNVDALFPRNGFDDQRLYTPQGDYALLQCRNACTQDTWPSGPIIERILPAIDPARFEVTDPAVIPTCPRCGGEVFFNVRLDDAFVEAPYEEQAERFARWARPATAARVLVVEIGAGFNTPGVVRWPLENVVYSSPGARFIRVNPDHPDVPDEIASRSVALASPAGRVTDALWSAATATATTRSTQCQE